MALCEERIRYTGFADAELSGDDGGYASHCDKEPYHAFLLSYSADTLQQRGVFNTSLGGEGASIWQSCHAPSIDTNKPLSDSENGSQEDNSGADP